MSDDDLNWLRSRTGSGWAESPAGQEVWRSAVAQASSGSSSASSWRARAAWFLVGAAACLALAIPLLSVSFMGPSLQPNDIAPTPMARPGLSTNEQDGLTWVVCVNAAGAATAVPVAIGSSGKILASGCPAPASDPSAEFVVCSERPYVLRETTSSSASPCPAWLASSGQ